MKKTIAFILTLMLCVSLLAACGGAPAPAGTNDQPAETSPAETAPTENGDRDSETGVPDAGTAAPADTPEESQRLIYGGDKFVGQWSDQASQRAYMTIIPTDYFGVYSVLLHWGDTAATFAEWDMTAAYDEASDSIRYTDGSRFSVTLHEDADEDRSLEWEASEGSFFFEDGVLRWEDNKEESDGDVAFEKVTTYAPTPEELVESFFKPVAEIPNGTAGAMLRKAQVACSTLRFADTYAIWSNDLQELRANLAEAWAGLSAEEQAAFDENIFAVQGVIVNAAVTWEDYSGLFEDAGVREEMQALERDDTAMESFTRLFDNAVTVCLAGEKP